MNAAVEKLVSRIGAVGQEDEEKQMFHAVGQEPESEVMIFTGTGNLWINERDMDSYRDNPAGTYDIWYRDSVKLIESLLWSFDIPTIAAINGPGFHTEFGLLCDLTIAADDAVFFEPHFSPIRL
jgi:enoyl-CoA hydratase/carnithine racemase